MSVEIRLKRINKIYHEGEVLAGAVVIDSKSDMSHQGITLTLEGNVSLQLSAKTVGMFEAFYNSTKPIQMLYVTLTMAKPGKLPAGQTEIPFECPLNPKMNKTLYETYHGVYVNIHYQAKVEVKRSLLNKQLTGLIEFIIEHPNSTDPCTFQSKDVPFTITPDSLQNIKEKASIPQFCVHGSINSTLCPIDSPFSGHLKVKESAVPIKSIELQLVRVETCGCAEGYSRDATEIQNIQIADGDVYRNVCIPIHMIFPRLFTCPSIATTNFKIEFEVNIVIILANDREIIENFPIKLLRV